MGFFITGDGFVFQADETTSPLPGFAQPGTTLPNSQPLSPANITPLPSSGQSPQLGSNNTLPPTVAVSAIQGLTADPVNPAFNQVWIRTDTLQLSINIGGSIKRVLLA